MPSFTFLSYSFWILSYRRKIIGWARMKRSSTSADSCTCGKKPTEPVTSLNRARISPLHQGQAAQETLPPWMSEVPSWTVWLVKEFSLLLVKALVIKYLHTRHRLLLPRLLFPFTAMTQKSQFLNPEVPPQLTATTNTHLQPQVSTWDTAAGLHCSQGKAPAHLLARQGQSQVVLEN